MFVKGGKPENSSENALGSNKNELNPNVASSAGIEPDLTWWEPGMGRLLPLH